MRTRLRLCSSDELGDNSKKLFRIGKREILAGRQVGKLFAFDNSCPHRGASLALGDIKGTNIVCHMHGYEFDIFRGNLVKMKSWKKQDTWVEQSPAWRASGNLVTYPVLEEGGSVYIELDEDNLS